MSEAKTKQELNISLYLSNEEPFKPLSYLICFIKNWKPINEKKSEKLTEEWNEQRPTQLNPSFFVLMQDYTLICVFQLSIYFRNRLE